MPRRSPAAGDRVRARSVETCAGEVAGRSSRRRRARASSCSSCGERGVRAGEDAGAHGAGVAQAPGDGAGVDAADADDARRRRGRRRGCAVARKFDTTRRGVAHDVARRPRCALDSGSSSFMPVLPMCGAVMHDDLAGVATGRSASPGSRSCRSRRRPRRGCGRGRRRRGPRSGVPSSSTSTAGSSCGVWVSVIRGLALVFRPRRGGAAAMSSTAR